MYLPRAREFTLDVSLVCFLKLVPLTCSVNSSLGSNLDNFCS